MFTHLHNHTEYSLLDGLSSIDQYLSKAQKCGFESLAITDHGNMHGVVDFYRKCKSANIHPVIGCEYYAVPFGTDETNKIRSAHHMLVLAQTQTGYNNMMKLSHLSYEYGKYYKPRITNNWLTTYNEGLIVTSGCMAAHIPSAIGDGNILAAENMTKWYSDVFGDRFYIELQCHPGIPTLNAINVHLLNFAKKFGRKIIITNDSHYASAEDASTHDILLCIQTQQSLSKPGRFKFTDNEYYLKTSQEMINTFLPYLPESDIKEYMKNAYDLSFSLEANPCINTTPHIPKFNTPDGTSAIDFLINLVEKNIGNKYAQNRSDVYQRIQEEMLVIEQTNFADYFLLIWDICNHARSKRITFNTRGSAAGSIINYIIGVSMVDPIENNLMFSRFLSPYRVSIPDCDLDFEDDRRSEMIEYIITKYGEEFVAQVVTFNHMKARAAIRDVGRAMDRPIYLMDTLAKSISGTPGKPITITNSLDSSSPYFSETFAERYKNNSSDKEVIEMAKNLENVTRQVGIHAAAVLIGDKPLIEYLPLMTATNAKTKLVSQLDYTTSESLGMLKVDLLGLVTLRIIRVCCELISKNHNIALNYDDISYTDESAFDLLRNGNTIGVFQLENSGMRRYLVQMQPKTFNDIAAMISLYRPGPLNYIPLYIDRMHGKVGLNIKHPMLESITTDTQGILIYQEQINSVFMQLAGYDAGKADKMRKNISKKDVEAIKLGRKEFVDGCAKNKISADVADSIYDDVNEFALYGFNRSHAASYARLSLITAYLKSNYMLEYLTACLICEGEDNSKRIKYIEDAKKNDIVILPPKIGGSCNFSIEEQNIRFGLSCINGIGTELARNISECENVDDLLELKLKTNQIRALVDSGCFDTIADRQDIVGNIDNFATYITYASKYIRTGQKLILTPKFIKTNNAATNYNVAINEYNAIGAYITYHPLSNLSEETLNAINNVAQIRDNEIENGAFIFVVSSLSEVITKMGAKMYKFIGIDLTGSIECLISVKATKTVQLKDGDIVHLVGNTDDQETLFVSDIRIIKISEV